MRIEKLKPGMVVYDVHSHRAGNTSMRTIGVWPVEIVAVDVARGIVAAKWNYNRTEEYTKRKWSKWRLKAPVLINTGWTHRLATRAEIKAMKAVTTSV